MNDLGHQPEARFTDFYKRYAPFVAAVVARNRCGVAQGVDVDDVVQEVLMRWLTFVASDEGKDEDWRGWFMRTTRNVIVDLLRRARSLNAVLKRYEREKLGGCAVRWNGQAVTASQNVLVSSPSDDSQRAEDAQVAIDAVTTAFETLNEREGYVVDKFFWDGLCIPEIAQRLEISPLQVRRIKAAALKRLRSYLASRPELFQD